MKREDLEALEKAMPTYSNKSAPPLTTPRNRTSRFLLKLKLKFFVNSMTESITIEATKNLKNTKGYASMYCKPIFIAGKEVPPRKPAKTVRRTAFLLLLAKAPNVGKKYSFLHG